MAVISYMPGTLWQVLLVLFILLIFMNHFPTDFFPPFICVQSSKQAFGFSLLDKKACL